MWPNAKISVMGGEQAANVLATVANESKGGGGGKGEKKEGKKEGGNGMTVEEIEAFKQPILDKYAQESSCYYSSARLWDDGVIKPEDTRMVLGLSLAVCVKDLKKEKEGGKGEGGGFGVFRM
jgi:acetyl-CoA carboxylase carboxyltransferase component